MAMPNRNEWLFRAARGDTIQERMYAYERLFEMADAEAVLSGVRLRLQGLGESYVSLAIFSGFPVKAIKAISWCRSRWSDIDWAGVPVGTQQVLTSKLLWAYKWIIGVLPSFPEISLSKIWEWVEDMERRYCQEGRSLRAVYMMRFQVAMDTGQPEEADHYFVQWLETPEEPDMSERNGQGSLPREVRSLSDCDACECDHRVHYYLERERFDEAFLEVRPILEGDLDCKEVPARTYAFLVMPALRLGKKAEAGLFHRRGLGLVQHDAKLVVPLSRHLHYVAAIGGHDKAQRLVEEHLPFLPSRDPFDRFHFFLATWVALKARIDSKCEAVQMRIPSRLLPSLNGGDYAMDRLVDLFAHETQELSRAFDQRNGNDAFRKKVERAFEVVSPHA